jgi:hypothetical protein
MPAPGPATVRLALLRTGIELFGRDRVRDDLFPILRSAVVRIRPPERVAISQQKIRGYKWSEDRQKRETIQESIIVREMAHARGPMTVFLQVRSQSVNSHGMWDKRTPRDARQSEPPRFGNPYPPRVSHRMSEHPPMTHANLQIAQSNRSDGDVPLNA